MFSFNNGILQHTVNYAILYQNETVLFKDETAVA